MTKLLQSLQMQIEDTQACKKQMLQLTTVFSPFLKRMQKMYGFAGPVLQLFVAVDTAVTIAEAKSLTQLI